MRDRCVHCGRPKDQHATETLACPGSGEQTYGTSNLPPGMTCDDCFHFKRTCAWLLSYQGTETACDWWPSRFAGPTVQIKAASAGEAA